MEKAIADESQEVSLYNDSYIWLRLLKAQDTLVNVIKMPTRVSYAVQETHYYYRLETVSMGVSNTAEINGIMIEFSDELVDNEE